MTLDDISLVQKICELFLAIDELDKDKGLQPSDEVNAVFTELVSTCIPPSRIDVTKLCKDVQDMRLELIKKCGIAEGLLELHYSSIIGKEHSPLDNLKLFPYYGNYLKLAELEYGLLVDTCPRLKFSRSRIAFVGSGPMPLTSIVLARNHMPLTMFFNYDIDESANEKARKLVSTDEALSQRMVFHTTDILNVYHELASYDVVFLAALVGMEIDQKVDVMQHLSRYMAPNAVLMLRSARGARAFLYPVVEDTDLPEGFEHVTTYHPEGEVINSVLVARRMKFANGKLCGSMRADDASVAPIRLSSSHHEVKANGLNAQILPDVNVSHVMSSRKEVSAA